MDKGRRGLSINYISLTRESVTSVSSKTPHHWKCSLMLRVAVLVSHSFSNKLLQTYSLKRHTIIILQSIKSEVLLG